MKRYINFSIFQKSILKSNKTIKELSLICGLNESQLSFLNNDSLALSDKTLPKLIKLAKCLEIEIKEIIKL